MADYLRLLKEDIEKWSKGNWVVENDNLLYYLQELNNAVSNNLGTQIAIYNSAASSPVATNVSSIRFSGTAIGSVTASGNDVTVTVNGTSGNGGGDMYKSTYDTDNDGIVDFTETVTIQVKNNTGNTVTKGTIVYIATSGSSADYPDIVLANSSSEATSTKTIGVVYADIANGATGRIITHGELHGNAGAPLDTSMWSTGTKLWLSNVDGKVTSTIPAWPNHGVFIGHVTRSQSQNGRILYAIQNGFEVNELHNVYNNNLTNNDLLVYNTSSTPVRWENKQIGDVLGYTPLQSTNITGATKTKITYNGSGLVTAGADATTDDINESSTRKYVTSSQSTALGTIVGTATAGQVLKASGSGTVSWGTDNDTTYTVKTESVTNGALTGGSVKLVSSAPSSNTVVNVIGSGSTSVTSSGTDTLTISSSDTNYYPTAITWNNGTNAGPTGTVVMSGTSNITTGAIPYATNSQSGVVISGVLGPNSKTATGFVKNPFSINTTSGSATVTLSSGTTTGFVVGQSVAQASGATNIIPSGTTISSIFNTTQFVISNTALSTTTGTSVNIGGANDVIFTFSTYHGFPIGDTVNISGFGTGYAASTTAGSSTITLTTGTTTGMVAGIPVSQTSGTTVIPTGSTIVSVTSSNQFTISNNALITSTGTGLTVGNINASNLPVVNEAHTTQAAASTLIVSYGSTPLFATSSTGTVAGSITQEFSGKKRFTGDVDILYGNQTPQTPSPKLSVNTINASSSTATVSLYDNVSTGTISMGTGLGTGGVLNLAAGGTGVTNVNIGHTNSIVTITGTVAVDGTITTINSTNVSTTERALVLGAVATTSNTSSVTINSPTVTLTGGGTTSGLLTGQEVTYVSGTGTFPAGATILNIINNTAFTMSVNATATGTNSITIGGATNVTANQGGIILKGTTDKTILYNNPTSSWDISETVNLASGKSYKINNTDVLTSTTILGYSRGGNNSGDFLTTDGTQTISNKSLNGVSVSSVVVTDSSGLIGTTSVLNQGRGGTGYTTYAKGDVLYSDVADSLAKLPIGTNGQVLTVSSSGIPSWQTSPSGFADPLTTAGDIIYRSPSNSTTRLGIGSTNQVLTVTAANTIGWATPVSGFADPLTTAGDIIYKNSSNVTTRLGIGTSNQVLTVTGTGTIGWATPTTGFANPLTTAGDILIRTATNAADRLGIGSTGQYLVVTGANTIGWQNIDADLKAIGDLTGTSGILEKTAANTWSLNTSVLFSGSALNASNLTVGSVPTSALPSLYIGGTAVSSSVANVSITNVSSIVFPNSSGTGTTTLQWSPSAQPATTIVLPSATTNNQSLTIATTDQIKDSTITVSSAGGVYVANTANPNGTSATFTLNQSANSTVYISTNATSSNTVSAIISRDASGNFNAGTATLGGAVIGSLNGVLTGSTGTVSSTGYGSTGQVLATTGTSTIGWTTPFSDPMTTAGDLIYRNSGNTTTRLGIGTSNQVLTVTGTGTIGWSTPATGFTDPMTTAGDIIFRNSGNTTTRLGIGTSNQVLTVTGAGTIGWSTPATGFSDPMTTAGDLIFRNSSNTTTRLGIGTSNQVLTVTGTGTIGWSTPTTGLSDPMTTAGDLIFRNSSNTTTRLGIGTSNQVLTVTGTGTIGWATPTTGLSDPMTTAGDLIFRNSSNTTTRLGIGTTNQVLTVTGTGTIGWATSPSGFADPMTTAGDLIFRNSSNTTTRLGIGTSNQVLTVTGTGTIGWATPSGGTPTVSASITAGLDVQAPSAGSVTLSSNVNIITTTGTYPYSAVTLQAATAGLSVTVVNKGTLPLKVYPASGASIDSLASNAAIVVPVNQSVDLNAYSTTQWKSSLTEITGPGRTLRSFLAPSRDIDVTTAPTVAGTTITFTTPFAHGMIVGETISTYGFGGTGYNLTRVKIATVAATTFTVTAPVAPTGTPGTTGKIKNGGWYSGIAVNAFAGSTNTIAGVASTVLRAGTMVTFPEDCDLEAYGFVLNVAGGTGYTYRSALYEMRPDSLEGDLVPNSSQATGATAVGINAVQYASYPSVKAGKLYAFVVWTNSFQTTGTATVPTFTTAQYTEIYASYGSFSGSTALLGPTNVGTTFYLSGGTTAISTAPSLLSGLTTTTGVNWLTNGANWTTKNLMSYFKIACR